MGNKIVVGDADSLVALAHKDDSNHTRAKNILDRLQKNEYEVIYPNTAILEAITALKRALNLVGEAHLINRQYQTGAFLVEFVNTETQMLASKRFEKTISKKNTIFDAIVIETAIKLEAHAIFSFDSWYPKEGFRLVEVSEK